MELRTRHAKPGRLPRLTNAELAELLLQVSGWTPALEGGTAKISKEIELADFKEAMAFVNRVAHIAEAENHHPDIAVHYNRVRLTLWTHVSGGLTENDLILAAKIDELSNGD